MIFHDSDFYGHHMMDMDFGHWFYLIFGIVVIFLSVIVLLYFLFQNSGHQNSKSILENEKYVSNKVNSNTTIIEEIDTKNANFCHNCGLKLDSNSAKFCAYCGEEL